MPSVVFSLSTDLFEYKFINTKIINSTFLHNKEGCQLDFSDDNNAYMIYFVSFLGTLAVLPGNIVSALLMDKIGRLRMLGEGRGCCLGTGGGSGGGSMGVWIVCSFCTDPPVDPGCRSKN